MVGGDCVSEDVGSRTKFGHGILQILGLATSPFRKKIGGKNGDKYPPVQRGDGDSGNGSPFSQPAGHNLVRPNPKVVFPLFLQFYPPSGTSKKPFLCSHSIIVVAGEPSRSSEQNQLNLGLGAHYFLTCLSSLNIMLWFLSLKCISSAKKPKAHPVLVQRSPSRGGEMPANSWQHPHPSKDTSLTLIYLLNQLKIFREKVSFASINCFAHDTATQHRLRGFSNTTHVWPQCYNPLPALGEKSEPGSCFGVTKHLQ